MKKKLRHIIVGDIKFNWRVVPLDDEHITLRVWLDGVKKYPWFNLKYPYRDPWLNLSEIVAASGGHHDFGDDSILQGITPGKIATIIENVLAAQGKPSEISRTVELEWDAELSIAKK